MCKGDHMALKPNPGRRGDPIWLPEVLRAFGVKVVEDPGWKMWGMGDFGTIWGVMAHHTGANNTSAQYIRYNPGISNALSSQIHLSRTGVVTLVGAGIAWHAGRGDYPGIATNNANAVTIGIEAQGDGQTWPEVEMEAYYRICAAICWYLGLPVSRVISHHEWAWVAQKKWDPGLNGQRMPMDPFRREVQKRIDTFNKYGTLNPVAEKEDEFTMADIEAIKAHITAEHEKTRKHITEFVAGFVGPIGSDVKDNRAQLTGGRNAGEYPGYPQIDNRTLVDAFAAMGEELGIPGFEDPHGGSLKAKQEGR